MIIILLNYNENISNIYSITFVNYLKIFFYYFS